MFKSGILNELEGCVREIDFQLSEDEEGQREVSQATPTTAPSTTAASTTAPPTEVADSPAAKYAALDDAAFLAAFSVDRSAFEKLSAWKQTAAKKKAGFH